jgi:hypothetical protein
LLKGESSEPITYIMASWGKRYTEEQIIAILKGAATGN